jgi:hypothetical protein
MEQADKMSYQGLIWSTSYPGQWFWHHPDHLPCTPVTWEDYAFSKLPIGQEGVGITHEQKLAPHYLPCAPVTWGLLKLGQAA